MAQLRNHKYFKNDADVWGAKSVVTVGHNRTLHRDEAQGTLTGRLHGHAVVTLSRDGTVLLDPCGYRTVTTRQAMRDFVEALTGMGCGVSFAKGGFTARIGGMDYDEDLDGCITVTGRG